MIPITYSNLIYIESSKASFNKLEFLYLTVRLNNNYLYKRLYKYLYKCLYN